MSKKNQLVSFISTVSITLVVISTIAVYGYLVFSTIGDLIVPLVFQQ